MEVVAGHVHACTSAGRSKQTCMLVLVSLLQELADEQQPLLITPDNLDRIIVSRLIESAPEQYPQQPFHYLLGCYNRAAAEQRSLGQDAAGQQLGAVVDACKQLLVSYAGLVLTSAGVVPEVSKDTADAILVQLGCWRKAAVGQAAAASCSL